MKASKPAAFDDLFMHEVIQHAEDGKSVLDLGCGGGSFVYSGHTRLKIFPADFAYWLRAETPPEIKARFVRVDSCCLPYKSDTFDICLCNFVLEHVTKPVEMLVEASRVLKSQGLFFVSIPNCKSLEDRIYRRLSSGPPEKFHHQRFTFKSFIEMAYSNTGFKLVSFCNWPGGFNYLTGEYEKYQIPMFYLFRIINKILHKNLLRESNYLFLLKKESKTGLRFMDVACRKCGCGHRPNQDNTKWICPNCGTTNITV